MDVKNKVVFEIQKEERLYRMEFPSGAPLGECYEACSKFLDKIVEYCTQHAERLRPKAPEPTPEEPSDAQNA